MRRELADLLICPTCRSTVEIRLPSGATGIDGGDLVCTGCNRAFAIVNGIPRMFEDIEDASTADRFAYEWQSFPEISDFYEKQFLDWIDPVGRQFFYGKTVLDAGCGKGRHVRLAARFGATRVVGLDVGKAIEVAYANTKGLRNVDLVQGDLCKLPLRPAVDYIDCVGVLHHVPRPEDGFKALCRLLRERPGGIFFIDSRRNRNPRGRDQRSQHRAQTHFACISVPHCSCQQRGHDPLQSSDIFCRHLFCTRRVVCDFSSQDLSELPGLLQRVCWPRKWAQGISRFELGLGTGSKET